MSPATAMNPEVSAIERCALVGFPPEKEVVISSAPDNSVAPVNTWKRPLPANLLSSENTVPLVSETEILHHRQLFENTTTLMVSLAATLELKAWLSDVQFRPQDP